jgi:hypothetical protein
MATAETRMHELEDQLQAARERADAAERKAADQQRAAEEAKARSSEEIAVRELLLCPFPPVGCHPLHCGFCSTAV